MNNEKKLKNNGSIALFLVGIVLSVGFLVIITISDSHLRPMPIQFEDPNEKVKLMGTYYPAESEYGILLCHGFGSDQIAMRPLASEFSKEGFHVFTFDFMGHGRSDGVLQYNNAETDVLAKQVLIALEIFKDQSGLEESSIFIIGHSMGARVALQSQTMTNRTVRSLVLFGVSINLQTNVQSDVFTGVQDANLEWIQNLNSTNPKLDLCVIVGTNDDILTPDAASVLLSKLNEGGNNPYKRDLILVDNVFHNYEIWTPTSIQVAKQWIKNQMLLIDRNYSERINSSMNLTYLRISVWIFTTLGLFISIIAGSNLLSSYLKKQESENRESMNDTITITDTKKWIKYKLLSWFPAFGIGGIIMMLLFIIPIGIPVFNIIFVGLISGYGLWMIIAFKRKRLPFSDNQYNFKSLFSFEKSNNININIKGKKEIVCIIILSIVYVFGISAWVARTGLFTVFPIMQRGFWLVLFSILTAFGYYIGQKELEWAKQSKLNSKVLIAISLIPFVLFLLFFLAIGSLAGMLGMFQNLIILSMVAFVGELMSRLLKKEISASLIQGILLQLLIIPQGALFASLF
mgnify:CR=1 FL=1